MLELFLLEILKLAVVKSSAPQHLLFCFHRWMFTTAEPPISPRTMQLWTHILVAQCFFTPGCCSIDGLAISTSMFWFRRHPSLDLTIGGRHINNVEEHVVVLAGELALVCHDFWQQKIGDLLLQANYKRKQHCSSLLRVLRLIGHWSVSADIPSN